MTDATTTPTDKAGEPVAWRYRHEGGWRYTGSPDAAMSNRGEPLYAVPDHSDVRGAIVKAIAFLKRDLDTDRINNTVESLLPDLVKADAILRGVKS